MNVIHRITLDLNLQSQTTSITDLSREIDIKYKDTIMSTLQSVVSKVETEENIFIDKIELDIRNISNEESFVKELREQLQINIDSYIERASSKKVIESNYREDPVIKESIIGFLKTGVFSWDALDAEFKKNKDSLVEILRQDLENNKSFWLNLFTEYPAVFTRMLIYFKECEHETGLALLQNVHDHVSDFQKLFGYFSSLPASELSSINLNGIKKILELLNLTSLSKEEEFTILVNFLLLVSANTFLDNGLRKRLSKKGIILSEKFYNNLKRDLKIDKSLVPKKHDVLLISPVEKSGNDISIPIFNAGIVLLHPFLLYLFNHLKLLKNNQFKNETFRLKGVQLLHYLSSFETEFTESTAVLSKILCGFSPEQPLVIKKRLSKKEKNECFRLLEEVIIQWEALKNTSPVGLVETYIRRQGILQIENDNITLTIERMSVDIMLQRLPWGISTIKLPWMKGIIQVNWD